MAKKWYYDLQETADDLLKQKYAEVGLCNYQVVGTDCVIEARWCRPQISADPILVEVHLRKHSKSVLVYELTLAYSKHL